MRHPLLNHPRPDQLHRLLLPAPPYPLLLYPLRLIHIALEEAVFVNGSVLRNELRYAEGFRVHRGLRDEAVRGGEAEDAGNEGDAAEKEEVLLNAR